MGLWIALLGVAPALAQEPTPASADEANAPSVAAQSYEAGKQALRGGELDDALVTFRKGLQAPVRDQLETWQLLLGAALTCEKLGRGSESIEYYRRFLDASEAAQKLLPPKWRERRVVVSDAVDELQKTLYMTHGYLTVTSTPSGASVLVGGKPVGVDGAAVTPFGLFLVPGAYQIGLELDGYEPAKTSVDLALGKLTPVSLSLAEIAPPPVEAAAGVAPVVAPASAASGGSGGAAWALVGGGSAILIGGVVCTVVAGIANGRIAEIVDEKGQVVQGSAVWDHLDERHVRLHEGWQITQPLSFVLYGVGIAAVTTGIVLMLMDDGEGESAASFGITPTSGGAYGQATLSF